MNNVIKVDFLKPIKLTGQERVSARDIWEAVASKQDFSNWCSYYFPNLQENRDYGIFNKVIEKTGKRTGRPQKNFWLTVKAAKSLAMMQNTAVGVQVRNYFLECEQLVMDHGLEHKITFVPPVMDSDFFRRIADTLEAETKRANDAEKDRDAQKHLRLVSEVKAAESLVEIESVKASPIDAALKYSLDAAAIIKQFPAISAASIEYRRTQNNRNMFNPASWVSIYLHTIHAIPKLVQKEKGKYLAYIFNLSDVEKVNQELTNA